MLTLAALPTAPGCALAFVAQAALAWGVAEGCARAAQRAAWDLTANAVRQAGRMHGPPTPMPTERIAVICVRAHVDGAVLRIGVWNSHPAAAPTSAQQLMRADNGRGTGIVEAISERRRSYASPSEGTAMGGEIARDTATAGSSHRHLRSAPADTSAAPALPKRRRTSAGPAVASDNRRSALGPPGWEGMLRTALDHIRTEGQSKTGS